MVNYRNYKVWEKAHLLVLEIYKILLQFPKDEQYNLVSQIKRMLAVLFLKIKASL